MSSKSSEPKLIRHLFASESARTLLEDNQLGRFADIWNLEAPWFEDPNERRDGVSGVVTWQLKLPDGSNQRIFIKRQENHNTSTYRHPFRGEPTFYREYRNIQMLESIGVPAIEVLYYGEALGGGKNQAILISRGLDGYISLADWFAQPENRANQKAVYALLKTVVKAIRSMHNKRVKHGCLYGKHLFVKASEIGEAEMAFDVRLLDLEKAKVTWFKNHAIEKDISQLVRHTPGLDQDNTEKLLEYYFEGSDLAGWRRRLREAILSKQRKQLQKAQEVA